MPEPTINEDELIGYIMRTVNKEKDMNLMYEEVRNILDAHINFLIEKGVAEKGDSDE